MPLAPGKVCSRWMGSAALFPFVKKEGYADFTLNVATKSPPPPRCLPSHQSPPPSSSSFALSSPVLLLRLQDLGHVCLGGQAWRVCVCVCGVSVPFTCSRGAHAVHGECLLIAAGGQELPARNENLRPGLMALAARTVPRL